jgi:UDP-glucose 4-epimerase
MSYLSKQVVAITGSSGFIGERLVNALTNSASNLILLVRTINPSISHKQIKCDLNNDNWSSDCFLGVDIVFHLAGCAHDTNNIKSEDYYRQINVDATLKIAKLASKNNVKKFVFVSSVKAGNESANGVNNNVKSFYGKTKYEAEVKLLEIGKKSNMSVIIVRPALVYGPKVKGNLGLMLSGIKKGWFPPLPDIQNLRSMVHVDDLVRALIFLVEDNRANGKVFVVTDGLQYSSREIYEVMCKISNKKLPIWSVPKFLFNMLASISPKLRAKISKIFDDEVYSSNKIESLGYKAKKTLKEINETTF